MDAFLEFIHKMLQEHPERQPDLIFAIKLGSSIYNHYEKWQYEPINIAKPRRAKVAYLLTEWMNRSNHKSIKEIVKDLDERLKSESSFNFMRENMIQRFLT